MKWAFSLKHKLKAAIIFSALTALLLVANLLGRHNVADLDKTLTSLRNDSLLPATFAHEINNLLFETKFLLSNNNNPAKIKANLNRIETLARKYEATDLT